MADTISAGPAMAGSADEIVRLDRKALAAVLSNADRIAPRGTAIDIASCVLLEAAGGHLTVRATDFTLWLTLCTPCEGSLSPVAVNASRLLDLASNIRSDRLAIRRDGSQLVITGQERARRSIPTLSANAFPALPEMQEQASVGLEASAFRAGVEYVRPFISDEISRPSMCGLHLHAKGGAIRAVGAFRAGVGHADVGSCLTDFRATVPPPFLEAVLRALPDSGPFFIVRNERSVEASWPNGTVRSPLIEGDFPDYERAIPAHADRTLHVHADELAAAVAAARSFGRDDKAGGSQVVALTMNGSVEVVARSDKGEAIEPVDAEFEGDALSIGLMAGQLTKSLTCLKSSPIQIKFGTAGDPVLFLTERFPDRRAVLMPVRI